MHAAPELRVEEPFHECQAANTDGVVHVLSWSRTVAIQRDGKTSDNQSTHRRTSWSLPHDPAARPAEASTARHEIAPIRA
jgi:hypothetical protein